MKLVFAFIFLTTHTFAFASDKEAPVTQPEEVAFVPVFASVGALFLGLKSVIADLGTEVRNASGEVRTQGEGLISSANQVASELEYKFRGDMDRAFDKLNKLERKFFEDTETLIIQMRRSTELLSLQAFKQAKITIALADISAFNATSIIKKYQLPRIVMIEPQTIKLDTDELEVTIYGNFLDVKKNYLLDFTTSVGAIKSIKPSVIDAQKLTFSIPEDYIDLKNKKNYLVSFRPYGRKNRWICKDKIFRAEPISLELTIIPRTVFSVFYSITPSVKIPIKQTFTFSYYDYSNDCQIDANKSSPQNLPLGWEFENPVDPIEIVNKETGSDDRIVITTANCGSDIINRPRKDGNRVVVDYKLKGCGPEVSFIFKIGCKGRGWLGYQLFLNGVVSRPEFLQWTVLETFSSSADGILRGQTKNYTYIGKPPSSISPAPVEIDWIWSAKIFVKQAGTEYEVELDNAHPTYSQNGIDILATFDMTTGKLRVSFL